MRIKTKDSNLSMLGKDSEYHIGHIYQSTHGKLAIAIEINDVGYLIHVDTGYPQQIKATKHWWFAVNHKFLLVEE